MKRRRLENEKTVKGVIISYLFQISALKSEHVNKADKFDDQLTWTYQARNILQIHPDPPNSITSIYSCLTKKIGQICNLQKV